MSVSDIKTSEGRNQLTTQHPSGRQLLIPSPLQTDEERIVNAGRERGATYQKTTSDPKSSSDRRKKEGKREREQHTRRQLLIPRPLQTDEERRVNVNVSNIPEDNF